MKKLILIFLLTLSSYATEQVTSANKVCIHQLENVIEKGWSDSNQTLNNFIIKNGTTSIPKILNLLDKPLSIKDGFLIVDNEYSPKLLLTRDDYIKLFSYVKYLEQNGEKNKAYDISIKALKGLNNTKSRDLLALIVHVMNEKIIVKSLKESLQHHRFSKEQKVALKKELSKLLLLDNQLLIETIDYDNLLTSKTVKHVLLEDKSTQEEEKKLTNKILFYTEKYCTNYNLELKKAILSDSFDALEAHRKKEIEEFKSFKNTINFIIDKLKVKLINYIPLSSDYTELAKSIAKSNFMVDTPSLFKTYKEYMTQVKSNQAFLESI